MQEEEARMGEQRVQAWGWVVFQLLPVPHELALTVPR